MTIFADLGNALRWINLINSTYKKTLTKKDFDFDDSILN